MKLAAPATLVFLFLFMRPALAQTQADLVSASASTERVSSTAPSAGIMTDAVRPFRSLGVGVTLGGGGLGIDLATPLAQRLELRGSGSYFHYHTNLLEQGATITADVRVRNASAMLDVFPFGNHLRVSAGATLLNSNGFNASLATALGQSYTLDGITYVSDPSDPVHGSIKFHFGKNVAPRVTLGYGNLLPKKGRFGISFEAGAIFTSPPTVQLVVAGSGCTGALNANCTSIDQTDIKNEQTTLINDVRPLHFYPVVSLAFSYKIGHTQPR